jgi:hypothetical protein
MFVLLYTVLSPWWRTAVGRNIMAVMGSLALIGAWGSWVNFSHDPRATPAFWQIRFTLFTVLTLAIGWRVVMLVRVQSARRKKEHEDEVR